MAYTHLGAAAPASPKALVSKALPKATTLVAKPAEAPRQIPQPPAPLPPRPKTLSAKEAAERLVKVIARENTIRSGIGDLLKQVRAATDKARTAVKSLLDARAEARRTSALKSPVKGVAQAAAAKASNAAKVAARAAADLKALKAALIVWQRALVAAKQQTKAERDALIAMAATPAAAVPPAPSSSPAVATADKQAEAVTQQVTKDVQQTVTAVVDETKKLVEETKQAAPEVAADLKAAIDEAKEPTKGAEAESNSAGGDGGSKMGMLPVLAAAAAGLWFLTRKRSA